MKTGTLFSFVLLLLLVTSCEPNLETEPDSMLVASEVFTSRIGDKAVYGVALRLFADQKSYVQYQVELKVNERVWLDTLKIEIPGRDTLESELIFSGSEVGEDDLVELNIKGTPLGR